MSKFQEAEKTVLEAVGMFILGRKEEALENLYKVESQLNSAFKKEILEFKKIKKTLKETIESLKSEMVDKNEKL
jgi:hypothetical protein